VYGLEGLKKTDRQTIHGELRVIRGLEMRKTFTGTQQGSDIQRSGMAIESTLAGSSIALVPVTQKKRSDCFSTLLLIRVFFWYFYLDIKKHF
jgi:hypothetical protein